MSTAPEGYSKHCNNCEYLTTLIPYKGRKYEVDGDLEFCQVCSETFPHRAIALSAG